MFPIQVDVTEQHIRDGRKETISSSAIGLAIKDAARNKKVEFKNVLEVFIGSELYELPLMVMGKFNEILKGTITPFKFSIISRELLFGFRSLFYLTSLQTCTSQE